MPPTTEPLPRPPRLHERLAFFVRLLGLALAVALAVRGLSYVGPISPGATPAGLTPLDSLLPVRVWSDICWAVAVVIVAGVFWRPAWTAGLLGYLALQGAWATSYLVASLLGISERGWVTSNGYLPEIVAAFGLLMVGAPPPLLRGRPK